MTRRVPRHGALVLYVPRRSSSVANPSMWAPRAGQSCCNAAAGFVLLFSCAHTPARELESTGAD